MKGKAKTMQVSILNLFLR